MATLNQAAGSAPRPQRTLDRVGNAADRIASINGHLMDMLDRFHGHEQPPLADGDTISASYVNQIGRLEGAIDFLDKLTADLASHA